MEANFKRSNVNGNYKSKSPKGELYHIEKM